MNGPATITWPSGDVFEFCYCGGSMQGTGTFHSHTGVSEERTYIDGVCHGPAVLHTPQVGSQQDPAL